MSTPRTTSLVHLQLSVLRTSWVFHLVVPALSACGILWIQARAGGEISPESARRLLGGAVCLAGLFSTVNTLAYGVNDRRQLGAYEFLMARGVTTTRLVAIELAVAVTFALPPMVATAVFGEAELDTGSRLSVQFVLALLVFASWAASVGVLAGLLLPKAYVGLAATSLPLGAAVFTPVLLPPEALPQVLAKTGEYLPSTIGTELVRATLHGDTVVTWWILAVVISALALLGIAAMAGQSWLARTS